MGLIGTRDASIGIPKGKKSVHARGLGQWSRQSIQTEHGAGARSSEHSTRTRRAVSVRLVHGVRCCMLTEVKVLQHL